MFGTDAQAAAGLLPFAASYALLAMLPGPNFAVVAQASMTQCRNAALLSALGIAAGAGLLAGLVAGGAAGIAPGPVAARVVSALYGAFLFWLGVKALRSALLPTRPRGAYLGPVVRRPFRLAFLTAIANPASMAFFTSSALTRKLPAFPSLLAVFTVALLWFGLLALALSAPAMRALHARCRAHVDMVVGAALTLLGCAALFSAWR